MTTLLLALVALVSPFPSSTPASWMSPESFRLALGQEQTVVEECFEERGWELTEGKGYQELIHEYDNGRTVSLSFLEGRLSSARFELATFPPESTQAFDELKVLLAERFGQGRVLVEDKVLSFEGEHVAAHLVLLDRFEGTGGGVPVQIIVARYFLRR